MISVRSRLIHNPIHQNYMRPLILCRERLNRLLFVLNNNNGSASLRDLRRSYCIWDWEIEQAAELGWVQISVRKPNVGRPSRCVEKLSHNNFAKLPPFRLEIEREINYRHQRFAFESVNIMKGGYFGFKLSTKVYAYLKTYPNAGNRNGAYASASRLMKRIDVQVARLWYRRTLTINPREPMPQTIGAIINRLRELGLL